MDGWIVYSCLNDALVIDRCYNRSVVNYFQRQRIMTKIKVGVQLHPQRCSYDDYASAVRQTEAMVVDSIWNWDHFFPL